MRREEVETGQARGNDSHNFEGRFEEMEVPFKLGDKKDVLVSKLKEARAKDYPSLNCSQDSWSGSSSKK